MLDATTGQNAVNQAREFAKIAEITGIILTKLDGTARGGVVLSIKNDLKVPVKFVGVGEGIDDLQPFNPKAFAEGLFEALPDDYNDDDIDLEKIRGEYRPEEADGGFTNELKEAFSQVIDAIGEINGESEEAPESAENTGKNNAAEDVADDSAKDEDLNTSSLEEASEKLSGGTDAETAPESGNSIDVTRDSETDGETEAEAAEETAEEAFEPEEKEEKPQKKKKGFFGRLFG